MSQPESQSRSSGLSGSLRVIAGMAILALAVLASLLVLDVIPHSMFSDLAGKILLLVLVVALATAALWVVVRLGKR